MPSPLPSATGQRPPAPRFATAGDPSEKTGGGLGRLRRRLFAAPDTRQQLDGSVRLLSGARPPTRGPRGGTRMSCLGTRGHPLPRDGRGLPPRRPISLVGRVGVRRGGHPALPARGNADERATPRSARDRAARPRRRQASSVAPSWTSSLTRGFPRRPGRTTAELRSSAGTGSADEAGIVRGRRAVGGPARAAPRGLRARRRGRVAARRGRAHRPPPRLRPRPPQGPSRPSGRAPPGPSILRPSGDS